MNEKDELIDRLAGRCNQLTKALKLACKAMSTMQTSTEVQEEMLHKNYKGLHAFFNELINEGFDLDELLDK